ncbi:MAG: hypothetical protein IJ209_06620 [Bacteroidaceae bacterium]|nr:hypothetical protein [Bacteroidaceae bacterium]
MKKLISEFLACLLLGTAFSACDNDMEWDIYPVVVRIQVVDEAGNSLLTDETASRITATFQGVTYTCREDLRTRTYMPDFYGLKLEGDHLLFGELDGEKNYNNEQIVIDCGDGSQPDVITLNHTCKWKLNGDPKISTSFKLNGKNVSGQIVIQKAKNSWTELDNE